MAIHLISDLHLHADSPWLGPLFSRTLAQWAGQIDALYILGDLFEYWVGDDDDDAFACAMVAAMHAFSRQTPLYIMHGNRDFLLGDDFARASGAVLLPDPHPLHVAGRDYLLSHGDALCSDDTAYQQFRTMVRQPQWQQAFLQKPLAERHAIARHIRGESEARKQQYGPDAISDVSANAVAALLAAHPGHTLIHGHTHRPAHHQLQVAGQPRERWVISDWHDGSAGYLRLDSHGVSAHPLR